MSDPLRMGPWAVQDALETIGSAVRRVRSMAAKAHELESEPRSARRRRVR